MHKQSRAWAKLALWGVLSAFSLSACSQAPEWKKHTSAAGKFAVSMPGTPKEETKALPIPGGSLDMKITQLENSQEAYLVAFMDFPNTANLPTSIQPLLAAMIKGGVTQSIKGTVQNEKESSLNGVPCRDFQATGKNKSKDARMSGKFCMKNKRLYQVFLIGEDTGETSIDKGDKFLSSFQISN
ncbi:MAG: hypothetical protein HC934_13295 [Acaryochloridaceae cyanobacterium SU_2_1]|nr:hypothetical protein [Acaryochloridaceae cyanobacterium SU_2_1]NJM94980.1 hypothetical protein [Acaryochloridaceae cyanobacterium CSU_5_19]